MKISMMWPTRKRPAELTFSLSSFIHNAKDNSNIEYIVVVDSDDKETINALEAITPMAYCYDAEITCLISDKRYGYQELEQYQNQAGKIFEGESFFICNDDLICLSQDWDNEFRKVLDPVKHGPHWIGLTPLNEKWKGSTTFVGINRKWYEATQRVSGTRATDGYIPLVAKEANITNVVPKVDLLHLQRGKDAMNYTVNGNEKIIFGLPSDETAGGYSSKTPVPPKYELHKGQGKQRILEDANNLKKWKHKNEK